MAKLDSSPEAVSLKTPSDTASDTTSETSSSSCESTRNEVCGYPYNPGASFKIYQHQPPTPFGYGYSANWTPDVPSLDPLTKAEYCLSRMPVDLTGNKKASRTITVTSRLAAGYERGPQVIAIEGGLVAKIYDPMYYTWINQFGFKEDIVASADAQYSSEAAAYEQLEGSKTACKYVPKYEGSWIMEVDTMKDENGHLRKRQVRLVLMEKIRGISMREVNAMSLKRKARNNILKRAIEAEAVIYHAGVEHNDFSPRNVILQDEDYTSKGLRVKLLDFDIAVVRSLEEKVYQHSELMENPIFRHYYGLNDFIAGGWFSSKPGRVGEWLWRHFLNATGFIKMMEKDGRPVLDELKCPMQEEVERNVQLELRKRTYQRAEGEPTIT